MLSLGTLQSMFFPTLLSWLLWMTSIKVVKSITIQLLKYFNSTCAFLLAVKLNICIWNQSSLSLQDLKLTDTKSLWDSLLHFLFFHYCYPAGASTEERVYGMIDPISLRLLSGSYGGSYWNKTLPRIQNTSQNPGGGLLPYMGYIGTCRAIEYGFWGSRSLNRVTFFDPFVLCPWCGP